MEEYTYLSPEEKLDKFLQQRNSKNNFNHIFTVSFISIVAIFCLIGFMNLFLSTPQEDKIIYAICIVVGIPLSVLMFNIKMKSYEINDKLLNKALNIPNKPFIQNIYSKDIKIVNAKFNRKDKHGLIFGEEKEILVTYNQQGIRVFIEKQPQKGEQCFLVCIESFDLPIAVFSGYYDGKKYPTWDCK